MRVVVPLSGALEECWDVDEAIIDFLPPPHLESSLGLGLRGLVLHTEGVGAVIPSLGFDSSQSNVVIDGRAVLQVDGVIALEYSLSLYGPDGRSFLRDERGNPVTLARQLGERRGQFKEFCLGGRSGWPPGDCELTVCASGGLVVSFDSNECRPAGAAARPGSSRLVELSL